MQRYKQPKWSSIEDWNRLFGPIILYFNILPLLCNLKTSLRRKPQKLIIKYKCVADEHHQCAYKNECRFNRLFFFHYCSPSSANRSFLEDIATNDYLVPCKENTHTIKHGWCIRNQISDWQKFKDLDQSTNLHGKRNEGKIIFLTQRVREAAGKNIERDGKFRFTRCKIFFYRLFKRKENNNGNEIFSTIINIACRFY